MEVHRCAIKTETSAYGDSVIPSKLQKLLIDTLAIVIARVQLSILGA